jgi:small subunit ribosomal protein S6e
MAEFKCVVSDPKDGKSYQVEVKGHHANALVGKKIGEEVDGLFVRLPGYKVQIVGGSDKEGFPMRPDLPGIARRKVLVSAGFGYEPDRAGKRKRKSMRGNTITLDIIQVNLKVMKHGAKPIPDMLAESKEAA